MPEKKKNSNFPYIITVILILLLIGGIRSIFELKNSRKKIDEVKSNIELLSNENSQLKEDISYVQTDQYIKETAHNQLRLTQPGYRILIINEKRPEDVNPKMFGKEKDRNYANWEKWLIVFNLEEIIQ